METLKKTNPWLTELRATLSLSWPLILANLAQHALLTSDVVLMGWLGSKTLAAGALATNLFFAILIFGIGLVSATAPLMAEEFGRNRHAVREVRRTVRQGFWTAISITIPVWFVLWHGESILLALGQDPELSRLAGDYLRTLQWSVLPLLLHLVLRSFVAALERPGWALLTGILALPVNVGVAWTLMFGKFGFPALGLAGAGIATTVSSTFLFLSLALVCVLDRRMRRFHLFGRFWRPDWPRFRAVWRVGAPIGLTLAFEVTIFNAAAILMGRIGAAQLAAHAIALQIASVSFMVPFGFAQAVTVRVGRAYGAQSPADVTRAGWTSFALGVGFMGFTAIVLLLAPKLLIGAFLDLDNIQNAAAVGYATSFLLLASIFQIADGAQAVGSGMLRGLQDTRIPMLLAGIGYWGVGLPMSYILAFHTPLQGVGVWIGLAVGLMVVAVLMVWRWVRREALGLVLVPEEKRPSADL